MMKPVTNGGGDHYPEKRRCGCCGSRKRCCVVVSATVLITVVLVILIVAFTVYKIKEPTTVIVSSTVEGVTPRVVLVPQLKVELNITLELGFLIHNPNHASFQHGPITALIFYRGTLQVAEAELSSGRIPPAGSVTLPCWVTVQADRFASEMKQLASDVLAGEIQMESRASVPGKVKFLIFHKHVVAVSDCLITIGVSDLKVRSQDCHNKIKL
ncbi:uncharacterized protein LOC122057943 [Macadamia integrifolia]|uniref:uncharacterized protein LOC122057943 n=1 Tax=Macadamia integrifolia TaxID=60698 RepID=UPI001C52B26D|nr:uncharacterized protein LOC122057943 [Macadamia integrifolia]